MAVSFTAFLAGIDAEIRTVITAMTAERSSAAGLIASVRFTPLVLFKHGSMILPTKCSVTPIPTRPDKMPIGMPITHKHNASKQTE